MDRISKQYRHRGILRKTGYETSCKIIENSLFMVTTTNETNMADGQCQDDNLRQFVSDECKAQATEVSTYQMIYI